MWKKGAYRPVSRGIAGTEVGKEVKKPDPVRTAGCAEEFRFYSLTVKESIVGI